MFLLGVIVGVFGLLAFACVYVAIDKKKQEQRQKEAEKVYTVDPALDENTEGGAEND